MRKYFGTDGIRRIANTELTPELVYKVAKAAAFVFSKNAQVFSGGYTWKESSYPDFGGHSGSGKSWDDVAYWGGGWHYRCDYEQIYSGFVSPQGDSFHHGFPVSGAILYCRGFVRDASGIERKRNFPLCGTFGRKIVVSGARLSEIMWIFDWK